MTKSIITFLCSLGVVWNSLTSMHWEWCVGQSSDTKAAGEDYVELARRSLFIEHQVSKIQTTFTPRLTRSALAAEKRGEARREGTLEECTHKECGQQLF